MIRRFADLIGQELASSVMKRAVVSGKINQAYLFSGPEGVGKMSAAIAFAAALNCESPTPDGDACGTCLSCRMMESGHPDIDIITPAGAQTKIDQMREMLRGSHYAPVRGKWRMIILEQADTMNEDSANAILKTLEEPPDYLIIILLSRNPFLLLQTIRSRCMLIRFASAPADELTQALIERFGADPSEAAFLSAYTEGRPGLAIGLIGNEKFAQWRREVLTLAERIRAMKKPAALRLSEEFQKLTVPDKTDKDDKNSKRALTRQAIDSLVLIYRDLLTLSVQGDSAELINSDVRDRLASRTGDPNSILAGIETLMWARRAVEGNANMQLISDVLMMRLMV